MNGGLQSISVSKAFSSAAPLFCWASYLEGNVWRAPSGLCRLEMLLALAFFQRNDFLRFADFSVGSTLAPLLA
jgi:hypothetical protein